MKINDLLDNSPKEIILEELEFEDNERVELLIYLSNYIGLECKVEDYYLVLGGREIITKSTFDNNDFMISNARKLLKTLNQKKVYTEALEDYDEDEFGKNIYEKIDSKYILKKNLDENLRNREEIYNKLLNLQVTYTVRDIRYAFKDSKRYGISIDDLPIEIELPVNPSIQEEKILKKNKNKKLKVTVEELIEEGIKIDNILSNTGDGYRGNILKNNKFKVLKNEKLKTTKHIELKEVTNIIGQVGAGKSTFADALTSYLVNKKNKILIIAPSVNKVFEKCIEKDKLGIKVAPIIGSSMWNSHIEKSIDGNDYLKEYQSRILTSACPLGGLIKNPGISIKYGQEPCNKIYQFNKNGSKLNKSKKYTCPYYYKCPRTKIYKEIFEADVIVTTSAALSSMSIGLSRMTVFQYVLEYIDLVIVDEAECELNKLDQIFAPIVAYDDYITANSDLLADHYKKQLEERTLEKENRKYIDFYYQSEKAFTKIYELIKNDKQGFSISSLKKPFSARSLINHTKNKMLVPEKVSAHLNKFIGRNIDKFTLKSIFDIDKSRELNRYLKDRNLIKEELKVGQVRVVIFIIEVLYFEHNYREMSNLVEGNDKLPMSTKNILSQRFEFQQRYLPVDPRGNIFKLQYKEDDYKSDLYIVKQFALGRSMYLRFPYLKIDSKGNAKGPKVLLLSGSSFAPGSFSSHINEKLNYIIEAEEYKTDFISKSHFEYYDTGVNISGSSEFERNENLKKLVINIKELLLDKLEEEKSILMIVNSYDDSEIVYKKLKDVLKETDYKDSISHLTPDYYNGDTEDGIKYSDIHKFAKTNFKILIASAILIERGHNIVDESGNSAFDTLMFLTRPMGKPDDYINHVCKVNGYIMSKYTKISDGIDIELFLKMITDAHKIYGDLQRKHYRLSDLPIEYQDDVMITLFIMILQIFGRLCRIGKEDNIKSSAPEVYFLDGAFKSNNEKGFDFLNKLIDYLESLINTEGYTSDIAKTLYLPFYTSLKKGKNIYGRKYN